MPAFPVSQPDASPPEGVKAEIGESQIPWKNAPPYCGTSPRFTVARFILPTGKKALAGVRIEFIDLENQLMERLEDLEVLDPQGIVATRVVAVFLDDSTPPKIAVNRNIRVTSFAM